MFFDSKYNLFYTISLLFSSNIDIVFSSFTFALFASGNHNLVELYPCRKCLFSLSISRKKYQFPSNLIAYKGLLCLTLHELFSLFWSTFLIIYSTCLLIRSVFLFIFIFVKIILCSKK